MTAPSSIDPSEFLHEQLSRASPDLLFQMTTTFIDTLMSADADAVGGATWPTVRMISESRPLASDSFPD
ncbi:hypothetical protein SAMN05216377_11121 [Pseudonocardia oroxyli]|uniref:Transposase, Mutator family n=1 Tax=Pseudonocardia oroxyli TaxID=366584 RepID=A0A1G7TFY4_PSEOR|nr:hypothetical protein [Pseudonocardia oroxyli]SDG34223.1 hypothetical protein SAMN05216377_11121 [Pseudonocardia oroxyli]